MLGRAWLRNARICLAVSPNNILGTIVTGPYHMSAARVCSNPGLCAGRNVRYWKCSTDHSKHSIALSRDFALAGKSGVQGQLN